MTTTTNVKLSTPSHGSNVDTWDADPVNNNSAILDNLFGTTTSKALTNVNVTLSATEAQSSILRFSGVLTGNVSINVGAIIKSWYIDNLTTGAFVVSITGGSGNVIGVPQGEVTQVFWDGANCKFINLGRVGSYLDDSGATVPAWVAACTVPPLLLCDGSTFSAVTYPYLNTKLGGTTLPDFRGRMAAYLNGGTGRITTAGSGIDGDTRFSSGGVQNVTLDVTMIPSHNHALTDPGHSHAPSNNQTFATNNGGGTWAAGASFGGALRTTTELTGITIANTGGGASHNNMGPTVISGIRMIYAA